MKNVVSSPLVLLSLVVLMLGGGGGVWGFHSYHHHSQYYHRIGTTTTTGLQIPQSQQQRGSSSKPSLLLLLSSSSSSSSSSSFSSSKRISLTSLTATSDDDTGKDATAKEEEDKQTSSVSVSVSSSSKRQMLNFAIPALGIYLSNPLLSNIDNAFVGHTVGTRGLAALSPATICTDQMLYLFSFLSRATTGLVSRAYGKTTTTSSQVEEGSGGNIDAARDAGSPPFTAALICGMVLSIFYAILTPQLLSMLNVHPSLQPSAASYIYWRGSVAWAALSQSVALSIMMATRDAITPLKIITLSAIVNIIGDYIFCVYPFQYGCSGAAVATAIATLVSSGSMIQALRTKQLLPSIRIPTKQEIIQLLEFTGPLLAITITRLIGFISMQRTAMKFGVQPTAAYQLSINLVIFFLLFGEPLSQLSQTKLPALLDDTTLSSSSSSSTSTSSSSSLLVRETYKSVLALGAWTALGIGSIAGLMLRFGSSLFSTDVVVQELAKAASPSVFLTVAIAIFAVTVDGTMLASRQFGFMLVQGLATMGIQLLLLKHWCTNISQIYLTFSLRLGTYAFSALLRTILGKGTLGRAIRPNLQQKKTR